jgi:hypothetical protein
MVRILAQRAVRTRMKKADRHRPLSLVNPPVKMRREEGAVHHLDKRNCPERAALETKTGM